MSEPTGDGTKDAPWSLVTPPGQSEYEAYRDETAADRARPLASASAGLLLAGVVAGGLTFLVAAKALRIEELDTLRHLLPGRSRATSGLG